MRLDNGDILQKLPLQHMEGANKSQKKGKRLNWVLYMEAFSCPDLSMEVVLHCL